jgi:hypothetical protein
MSGSPFFGPPQKGGPLEHLDTNMRPCCGTRIGPPAVTGRADRGWRGSGDWGRPGQCLPFQLQAGRPPTIMSSGVRGGYAATRLPRLEFAGSWSRRGVRRLIRGPWSAGPGCPA